MSHFTVLVIGENPEKQLEPFDENIEFPEYEKGLVPEEEKKRFVEFYTTPSDEKYFKLSEEGAEENKKLSFDELYGKYGEGWNGDCWSKNIDDELAEYSTYNKNSKWDWYQLGGRWTGFFKLKEGATGEIGERGIYPKEIKKGFVDQAYKGDIDFLGMEAENILNAEKNYDDFLNKFADESENKEMLMFQYGIKNIGTKEDPKIETKEDYVERHVGITTYAVLKHGQWYEKGTMGWWGISTNEVDDWDKRFNELLKDLPDDTLLSLYDCHI
jgi:hypothetical protein